MSSRDTEDNYWQSYTPVNNSTVQLKQQSNEPDIHEMLNTAFDEYLCKIDSAQIISPVFSPITSPDTLNALNNAEKLVKDAQRQMMEMKSRMWSPNEFDSEELKPYPILDETLLQLREKIAKKFEEAHSSKKLPTVSSSCKKDYKVKNQPEPEHKPKRSAKNRIRKQCQSQTVVPSEPLKNRTETRAVQVDSIEFPRSEANKKLCTLRVQNGPMLGIRGSLSVQTAQSVHISPDSSFVERCDNVGTFKYRYQCINDEKTVKMKTINLCDNVAISSYLPKSSKIESGEKPNKKNEEGDNYMISNYTSKDFNVEEQDHVKEVDHCNIPSKTFVNETTEKTRGIEKNKQVATFTHLPNFPRGGHESMKANSNFSNIENLNSQSCFTINEKDKKTKKSEECKEDKIVSYQTKSTQIAETQEEEEAMLAKFTDSIEKDMTLVDVTTGKHEGKDETVPARKKLGRSEEKSSMDDTSNFALESPSFSDLDRILRMNSAALDRITYSTSKLCRVLYKHIIAESFTRTSATSEQVTPAVSDIGESSSFDRCASLEDQMRRTIDALNYVNREIRMIEEEVKTPRFSEFNLSFSSFEGHETSTVQNQNNSSAYFENTKQEMEVQTVELSRNNMYQHSEEEKRPQSICNEELERNIECKSPLTDARVLKQVETASVNIATDESVKMGDDGSVRNSRAEVESRQSITSVNNSSPRFDSDPTGCNIHFVDKYGSEEKNCTRGKLVNIKEYHRSEWTSLSEGKGYCRQLDKYDEDREQEERVEETKNNSNLIVVKENTQGKLNKQNRRKKSYENSEDERKSMKSLENSEKTDNGVECLKQSASLSTGRIYNSFQEKNNVVNEERSMTVNTNVSLAQKISQMISKEMQTIVKRTEESLRLPGSKNISSSSGEIKNRSRVEDKKVNESSSEPPSEGEFVSPTLYSLGEVKSPGLNHTLSVNSTEILYQNLRSSEPNSLEDISISSNSVLYSLGEICNKRNNSTISA